MSSPSPVYEATCTAPVNIAVVKYWGKRDTSLILPTNSSLSVTLSQDDLRSLTTARAIPPTTTSSTSSSSESNVDRLWLNGTEEEIKEGGRTATCLAELRKLRKSFEEKDSSLPPLSSYPLHIASENNFPTAAGLASSASGLSALIATISSLYSLSSFGISTSQLSRIARQGSGSACRSMFGGYVGWEMGSRSDGSDSGAYEVAPVEHWDDLDAIILVVSDKKKGTASTVGMQKTVATSSLLQHRIKEVVPERMRKMEKAIKGKDFRVFAEETMRDSNQFHAVCLDTSPPIFYLNDTSRQIIQLVEELNRSRGSEGPIAAYTFDAGPNAVLYVQRRDTPLVLSTVLKYFPQEEKLEDVEDMKLPEGFNEKVIMKQEKGAVSRIIRTKVGDGPRVLDTEKEGLLAENGMPKNLA
ncbi:diphosphomevalonate decarboxylase MVD1 [Sporobolomyces salmoneus]|uniref:diphosphomevalonate decarboxylase MVD1 n=1 Tax=Sporobolomyces salmoneus TaxID=183962 RepID=UPI003180AE32